MLDADRRVILAAEGAAHATETRMETEELTRSPETLLNRTLMEAMHRQLEICGAPRLRSRTRTLPQPSKRNWGCRVLPWRKRSARAAAPRYVPGSTDGLP